MKIRTSKLSNIYYTSVLTVLFLSVMGVGYYYWGVGPVNIKNAADVLKASTDIEEMKKVDGLEIIKDLVIKNKIQNAEKQVVDLQKMVVKLNNSVYSPKVALKLEKEIVEVRNTLNKLISFSNLSSVVTVVKNKIISFNKFSVENNWRTLSRVSQRVKVKLKAFRYQDNIFDYRKMKRLEKDITRNIKLMSNITKRSALSAYDKKIILMKLKSFDTEIDMLQKHLPVLNKLYKDISSTKDSFNVWISEMAPEVTMRKMQMEKRLRTLVFAYGALVLLLLVFIMFGFFIQRKDSKNQRRIVEKTILNTVKNGIVSERGEIDYAFSDMFINEFNQYKDYLEKRMSFGTIFQETVPFATLLLDSNLNMIWANSSFYEKWGIEKINSRGENFNWEILQRKTNLGENDPLVEAVRNKVAGIYQIQFMDSEKVNATPYEMYVSPIDYMGQLRILLIFYPLSSLEETINDQRRSLVGPIGRSLDALVGNEYNKNFRENIERDFKIAGIGELFERFNNYEDIMTEQKIGFVTEIEKLENEVTDLKKIIGDMGALMDKKIKLHKGTEGQFVVFKGLVIKLVDFRKRIEQLGIDNGILCKKMYKRGNDLLKKTKNISTVFSENIRAFSSVVSYRDKLKQDSSELDKYKTRIVQTIDQAMIFTKTQDFRPEKIVQALAQIKVEMKNFEKESANFASDMKNLDIHLSKNQMIIDDVVLPPIEEYNSDFKNNLDGIEEGLFNIGRSCREGSLCDDEIIKTLKHFYSDLIDDKFKNEELSRLMNIDNVVEFDENSIEPEAPLEMI